MSCRCIGSQLSVWRKKRTWSKLGGDCDNENVKEQNFNKFICRPLKNRNLKMIEFRVSRETRAHNSKFFSFSVLKCFASDLRFWTIVCFAVVLSDPAIEWKRDCSWIDFVLMQTLVPFISFMCKCSLVSINKTKIHTKSNEVWIKVNFSLAASQRPQGLSTQL